MFEGTFVFANGMYLGLSSLMCKSTLYPNLPIVMCFTYETGVTKLPSLPLTID